MLRLSGCRVLSQRGYAFSAGMSAARCSDGRHDRAGTAGRDDPARHYAADFLSAHGDLDMAVDAMRRGACAFIQKTADRARLLQAIVDAMAKSRGTVGGSTPGALVAAWNTLTDREKEVAKLVAEGLLNREVGERLGGIAVKTVQVHRSEACSKLGVKGAAGLAQAVRAVERALKVRQTP